MLLQKILTLLLSTIALTVTQAQVQIDRSMQLTGTNSSDRQVSDLGDPVNATSAIRAEDVKYGRYNFAQCTGIDTLILSFDGMVDTLIDGDLFFFVPSAISTKDVYVKCNFFPAPFPLMLNGRDTATRGNLIAGKITGAIYSGGKAYLITPTSRTCPTGFIKVNDNYCIEKTERAATNFFGAASDCFGLQTELCTWAEWHFACVNAASLTITGMTNNYEWLDDAANASLQVKIVGNSNCTANGTAWANTGNYTFRCCYRLK